MAIQFNEALTILAQRLGEMEIIKMVECLK